MQLSGPLRYVASIALTESSGYFGFKLSPLGFGLAFPLVERNHFKLEVGGMLPLVELRYNSYSNPGLSASLIGFDTALLSVITLSFGSFFFSVEPVGLEFSWLDLASSTTNGVSTSNTVTGFSAHYRFAIIAGWNF